MPVQSTKLTSAEIAAIFDSEFPQIGMGKAFRIETVEHCFARVRMIYGDQLIRPGGTISGPSIFTLADLAMYIALLASVGPVVLAVTTNFNINFLRKPDARDMLGKARILKLGKRLVVGEIALHSDGEVDLVAHATATYSIPR